MDNLPLIEKYLSMPPWDALISMINDRYQLELFTDTTTLIEIEEMSGGRLTVTIAVDRSKSQINLLPPLEQRTFLLDRLDFSVFFPQGFIIRERDLSTRPSTLDIVREIRNRHPGLFFSNNDIIHEEIDHTPGVTTNYTLRAHPRSLRWFGETQITLLP